MAGTEPEPLTRARASSSIGNGSPPTACTISSAACGVEVGEPVDEQPLRGAGVQRTELDHLSAAARRPCSR